MSAERRSTAWVFPADPGERVVALWAFAYFFALLAAYYILRPLRDQMSITGGTRGLPWLVTGTLIALIVVQPIFGALARRLPRARLVAVVYQFFVVNLALFWLLLTLNVAPVGVARAFFIWVSVFNVFAVAVFWSLMADLFTSEQGKRLFGFIGAGGTLGGLLGPILTIALVGPLGSTNLILIAIVLLELAVFAVYQLNRRAPRPPGAPAADERIGGGILSGVTTLVKSPYLLGIAAWVSLLSFGGTILYFEQQNLVSEFVHGAEARTRLYASMDLTVNFLTLFLQVVATAQVLKRLGTGMAAAALPVFYVIGFAVLAAFPILSVVVVFNVIQRCLNFSMANPARQVFYTVVARDEKYKAKNVVDVVVFRGSDSLWGWAFDGLQFLGLKIAGIALCSIPVAAGWAILSHRLGRHQEQRALEMGALQVQKE